MRTTPGPGAVLMCAALMLLSTACLPRAARHPECDRHSDLCALNLDEIECEHAREFCPQAPEPLVNLGLIAQSRGKNDEAREYYVQALRRDVECAQAYNNLGAIELAERNFSRAAERFERALKVNPDYNEARHNLGLAHWRQGKLDQADKDFRHMIAANAALSQPYGSLGALALERGRYEEAARWLARAVLIEPAWTDAWRGLAAAREAQGQWAEAAEAYESCLDSRRDDGLCREGVRRTRAQ